MRIVLAVLIALAVAPSFATAQECNLRLHGETTDPCSAPGQATESRFHGHAKWVVANAGVGAVTAGLSSYFSGGSFWKGALGGATGGALSYAGKAIVVSDFRGSGIIGRQVGGVGSSVVFNASRRDHLFAHLELPFGPLRLDVDLDDEIQVRPRLDLANLVATAVIAAQPKVTLDWRYTLSTGAPVFVDQRAGVWAGRHSAGVITVKQPRPGTSLDRNTMDYVVRHERVHLLQSDFTAVAWGRPAEAWALSRVSGGMTVHRFVALRADLILWGLMNSALSHSARPTEDEAYFLHRSAGVFP